MTVAERKNPEWFLSLLRSAEVRAGSRYGLSKALGIKHQSISGWHSGSVPGMDSLDALLRYLGADLEKGVTRSMPDWIAPEAPAIRQLAVVGRIAAVL